MPFSSPQNVDTLHRSLSGDSNPSVFLDETQPFLFAAFSTELLYQFRVAIAFYNSAKENFNLNRYAEVELETTQALHALESDLPTVFSYLQEPLLVLRANARRLMLKYREAELDYSIALLTLVWTERVQSLLYRAICRLWYQDFSAAEHDLNLVINSRFGAEVLYEALHYRSHVYYYQKKYSQAAADALAAMSSRKLSSTLKAQAQHYYLASSIENNLITEDTEKSLSELIESDILPCAMLATTFFYRGYVRHIKKKYDQAKNDFAEALYYPLLAENFKVQAQKELERIRTLETINSKVTKTVTTTNLAAMLRTKDSLVDSINQSGTRTSAFKRLK